MRCLCNDSKQVCFLLPMGHWKTWISTKSNSKRFFFFFFLVHLTKVEMNLCNHKLSAVVLTVYFSCNTTKHYLSKFLIPLKNSSDMICYYQSHDYRAPSGGDTVVQNCGTIQNFDGKWANIHWLYLFQQKSIVYESVSCPHWIYLWGNNFQLC